MRPAHVTLSHVIQPLHENYDIRNVYFIVIFIIVKLLMLVADIRISEARSRMDMLPDYFEAAATSKICLSGTRGSA